MKDKILIVGGYGSVGGHVTLHLAHTCPGKVIVAGRSLKKARSFILNHQITAIPASLNVISAESTGFDIRTVHTAISCLETQDDKRFLELCIQNKINYTELATSYESYLRLISRSNEIKKAGLAWIPGVGIAPGMSDVFSQYIVTKLSSEIITVESFVLLSLGEKYGIDSIRWMLQACNENYIILQNGGFIEVEPLSSPKSTTLLTEQKERTFLRFNFGDQRIIPRTLEVSSAETRIAFASKLFTNLLKLIARLGMRKAFASVGPELVARLISFIPSSKPKFAIQTRCIANGGNQIIYELSGESEIKATAVIAAYAVDQLYTQKIAPGTASFGKVIDSENFFEYLANHKLIINNNLQ